MTENEPRVKYDSPWKDAITLQDDAILSDLLRQAITIDAIATFQEVVNTLKRDRP